jgi:hypothetical protein
MGALLLNSSENGKRGSPAPVSMSGRKNFDAQLAALDELRQRSAEECIAPLRAALRQKNNYLVAKAAELVGEKLIADLMPELLEAFGRFFDDPVKTDPQCWAKNALGRALARLEYQEPEPFLRGMRHVQLEPVWGGRSDTAGTLRGTCGLALVQCRTLPEAELLRYLIELLADKDDKVRGDAVRAMEQVGSTSAALLLRLRAQIGSSDPDDAPMLGGCYAGVLRLEGASALAWVATFLRAADDAAGEAALAMASTHSEEAFRLLKSCWEKGHDPWFSSILLSAIALTRQEPATQFLLDQVAGETRAAEPAIEALLRSRPGEDVVAKLRSLVEGSPRLEKVFRESSEG